MEVKEVLNGIVEQFISGDIPNTVALATFPKADIPSSKWSFRNRLFMVSTGTDDARGIAQWREVKRRIKKGAKAIPILVPRYDVVTNEDTDEEQKVLYGFKPAPVFRYEDTIGKKIDYKKYKVPSLPLKMRAEDWGISVKGVPDHPKYYGYYCPAKDEIGLASKEEISFFHELAHVAHKKIKTKWRHGQDPFQEIVAELSAQTLCRIVGKSTKDTTGNSYTYIQKYASEVKMTAPSACLHVLKETEKVLELILKVHRKR